MPQRATGRLTFAKCGAVVDIAKSAGIPRMHRIVITAGLSAGKLIESIPGPPVFHSHIHPFDISIKVHRGIAVRSLEQHYRQSSG
jgi:hypothetical protein